MFAKLSSAIHITYSLARVPGDRLDAEFSQTDHHLFDVAIAGSHSIDEI